MKKQILAVFCSALMVTTIFFQSKHSQSFDGSGVATPVAISTPLSDNNSVMYDKQTALPLVAVFVLFVLVHNAGCNPK